MKNKKTEDRSGAKKSGVHAASSRVSQKKRRANRPLPEEQAPDLEASAAPAAEETPLFSQEPAWQGEVHPPAKGRRKKDGTARREERAQAKAARQEEKAARTAAARPARKKALKKVTILLSCLLGLVLVLGAGVAYAGYRVTCNGVNFPKVYVDTVFVGGLTQEQTLTALEESGWDQNVGEALRVELPAGASFKVDLCDAGILLTKESAAAAAYRFGHDGNWFSNLLCYLGNFLHPVDVTDQDPVPDQNYIRSRAQSGIDKFQRNTALKGEPYKVDEEQEQLRLVKGAGEMEINLDALCSQVTAALLRGDRQLTYDHIDNELAMPDFDVIHTELAQEPRDASFANAEFDVIDEVVGCDFDVTQAKTLWQNAQPGEEVLIPLSITYPEITGEELRSMLFRDCLGSQTTSYSGSSAARINNIHLAAEKINDVVLMPGEQFSYNEVVGERTTEAGFQAADAYNDGEVVQEIGGGICQVSSTLYCATLYAQLETVERTNHYFKVGYLPYSMDATVSWGGPEFIFKNSRDYPVKIVAYCDDDSRELTIQIWGTDVDGTYVELSHETYMIYDDVYTDVVIGYAVQGYQTIYDRDGNWLDRVKGPYDIYHFHDYDIAWPPEKTDPDSGGDSGDSGGDAYVDIPSPPPVEPTEPEVTEPTEPDPYL